MIIRMERERYDNNNVSILKNFERYISRTIALWSLYKT